MIGLTRRQRDLLDLLIESPVCPTWQQMRRALGLRGNASVTRLLAMLEERGCIRRRPGRHRSIEVLVDFPPAPARLTRAQGLAFARAWRIANKPYFDALYGAAPDPLPGAVSERAS